MDQKVVIAIAVACCCCLLSSSLALAMSSASPSPADSPATAGGAPPPAGATPPPPPSVPQGMIKGKVVKIARADNRAEYINILGIDLYDQAGARITTGITPTIGPAVYANDPSQFGPQYLIDGIHTESAGGRLRLPHTTNVPNAYMQLELAQDTVISKIVIWNRTACCGDRINGCTLTVTNTSGANVLSIPLTGSKAVYTFSTPLTNTSTSSTYVPEPYFKD